MHFCCVCNRCYILYCTAIVVLALFAIISRPDAQLNESKFYFKCILQSFCPVRILLYYTRTALKKIYIGNTLRIINVIKLWTYTTHISSSFNVILLRLNFRRPSTFQEYIKNNNYYLTTIGLLFKQKIRTAVAARYG